MSPAFKIGDDLEVSDKRSDLDEHLSEGIKIKIARKKITVPKKDNKSKFSQIKF